MISTIRRPIAAIAIVAVTALAGPAVLARQRGPVAVKTIRAITVNSEAVVVIEADGPLPPPVVGTVDDPPRIFLDFAGVTTRAPAVTRGTDARVRRVRVAVHSAQPLVTRVVLDLAAHEPHRIEQSPGRLLVAVGTPAPSVPPPPAPAPATAPAPPPSKPAAAAAEAPRASMPPAPGAPSARRPAAGSVPERPFGNVSPVPDLPEPPPSARSGPAIPKSNRPAIPPPPAKDLERYKTQVRGPLDRLKLQQPLLQYMSSDSDVPFERLQTMAAELERLAQELSAITPPETIRPQHDLVLQTARLGVMATTLRMEAIRTGDRGTYRNAMSAASGAVLSLTRVCEELRCQ